MSKIISIYYYIASFVICAAGLFDIVFAEKAKQIFGEGMSKGQVRITGIIFIVFSFLIYFLAQGLWKNRKWAFYVVTSISVIGILWAIYGIAIYQGLISFIFLIINGLIISLMMTKKTKLLFNFNQRS